jgi:hypothetical protein
MIYSLVGTKKEVRDSALKEMASLGEVNHFVYSENIDELKGYIDARTMFDENIIVSCVQLLGTAGGKEIVKSLLPRMEASLNTFIIDEPFVDVHGTTLLSKYSKKLFNGKEEKTKDTSVFVLCDSFARKDKKQAWLDFMAVRDAGEGEAIAGALWWKFQIVWQGVKDGKRSPFTEKECERIGEELVSASVLSHRGEKDLMIELERIILSL